SIQQTAHHPPLYCHPKDVGNPVLTPHVLKAAALHLNLSALPRKNPVWAALRAFWAAVTSYEPDYRYPLFWQGLESLFGADAPKAGLTKRLCKRISLFIAETAAAQRDLYEKVEACYNTRSAIVHGRLEEWPDVELVMSDTEAIVRTVIRHLACNSEMMRT